MATNGFSEVQGSYYNMRRISRGTFSVVYQAESLRGPPGYKYALKRIMQTSSPERIAKEMKILMDISGQKNVCPLLTTFRNKDQVTLVMPYFQHDPFRTYYNNMDLDEIRLYLRALFESLELIHSLGIIHRDIKPSNFLYNRTERKYQLIDFGLAQRVEEISTADGTSSSKKANGTTTIASMYRPELKGKSSVRSVLPGVARAGTRGFRAPEIVLFVPKQAPAIDIWSAGSIMLSIATQRYPFFESTDDLTALVEMAHVFGSKRIHDAAAVLGRNITLPERIPGRTWPSLCDMLSGKKQIYPPEFYDLLDRCLEPVPHMRIAASEALRHPFLARQEQ